MINFSHFLQALIILAKPEKNIFPSEIFFIDDNSSKLAPAQNARFPEDFITITFTNLSELDSVILSAISLSIFPGKELL